jgi:hypothetical protein
MKYPETIQLEVTQADIDAGERMKADRCPAAIAARRLFRRYAIAGTTSIEVFPKTWLWSRSHTVLYRDDSGAMSRFVLDFDAGRHVAPVTITLRLERR